MRHIILQPPIRGKYEAMRTAILAKTSISDAKKLQKLMQGVAFCDGKRFGTDDVSQKLFKGL